MGTLRASRAARFTRWQGLAAIVLTAGCDGDHLFVVQKTGTSPHPHYLIDRTKLDDPTSLSTAKLVSSSHSLALGLITFTAGVANNNIERCRFLFIGTDLGVPPNNAVVGRYRILK